MLHRTTSRLTWLLICILCHGVAVPYASAQTAFPQGIGSGDVATTTATLWSRTLEPGEALAELALDDTFSVTIAQSVVTTSADQDHTVRIEVNGLQPSTRYFYRFIFLDTGEASPIGSFRTAPADDDPRSLRFVYSGDSHAAFQPFTLLKHAADEAPDFWFWAGDTMYADSILLGLPPATDLEGFREKHRENRDDAHLRNLLAVSPVWAQWDDHELGNDYDGTDLSPRFSEQQRRDAYQAFFEYMPLRPQNVAGDEFRIYRSVRYGALAEFFILDCRQYRSRSVERDGGGIDPRAFVLPTLEVETIVRMGDPSRTMLGAEQLAWLKNGLQNSTAKWKFILSSVPFTSLLILPYDRWDGYVAERYDLLRFIDERAISGVVLLATDIHANLHNPDVTQFLRSTMLQDFSPCYGVPEFVAGPIGVDTLKQEARFFFGRFFDLNPTELDSSFFFSFAFDIVAARVAAANGLTFIEPNKFAYLVVEVNEEGVRLTHRGIPPDPAVTDAPLENFNAAMLPDQPQTSCAPGFLSPLCMILLVGMIAGAGGRRRTSGSKACTKVNPSPCRRASAAGAQ